MLEGRFAFGTDGERSLEADPRLVTRDQLAGLRELGFRRISFGVQDFDPVVQAAIGRLEPEAEVRRAVELARETGFEGVNVDLVYGLPSQTPGRSSTPCARLSRSSPIGSPAITTRMCRACAPTSGSSTPVVPSRDEKFHLFRMAVDALTGGGYEWIGLDHFARAEDELAGGAKGGYGGTSWGIPRARPATSWASA